MSLMKKVFTSEIKSIDEKDMSLTAYISTGAVDRMGEVLDPSGVDLGNYRKNPVVLWAHDYSQLPIGKAMWVKKDGEGIISKVKFASHDFAKEVFNLYKEGFLKAFSVGFIPKKWDDKENKKEGNMSRTYTHWEMLEYSAVPVPANPEALALAMQKGLMKDKALIDSFKVEEPIVQEFNHEQETSAPDTSIIAVKMESNPLDDLMAENKTLSEKAEALDKENAELRYKLYMLNKERNDAISGITANNALRKEIEGIVSGVIRKAQGKLD